MRFQTIRYISMFQRPLTHRPPPRSSTGIQIHESILRDPSFGAALLRYWWENPGVVPCTKNSTVCTARLPASYVDIGCTPTFLLWMPDFKSKTSFGFPIENYLWHVFWVFHKTLKRARLASFRVLKKIFSRGFLFTVSAVEPKIDFFTESNCCTRITCV